MTHKKDFCVQVKNKSSEKEVEISYFKKIKV